MDVLIFSILNIFSRGDWRHNLMWLEPFFSLLDILPYTFLALLDTDEVVDMLSSVDVKEVINLPTDGIISAARRHSFTYQVRNRWP